MSPSENTSPRESRAGQWWLAATMTAVGAYCLAWPDALLDEYWDRLPDPTSFGYALGAIFTGGGIVFFLHSITSVGRNAKLSRLGQAIGGLLISGGFAYVFWTIFDF